MKLTLHVKDVGFFELLIHSSLTAESLDDNKLASLRSLISSDALYVQLIDKSYLFLGKEMLKNSYMILETEDETDLLP